MPPQSCLKQLTLTDSGGDGSSSGRITARATARAKGSPERRARFADDELATCLVTGEAVAQTPEHKKRIRRLGSLRCLCLPRGSRAGPSGILLEGLVDLAMDVRFGFRSDGFSLAGHFLDYGLAI